jgi:hypothetical protein
MRKLLLLFTLLPTLARSQTILTDSVLVAPLPVLKDTTYWKKGIQMGINLTQANFSKNWKAGGSNNFSFSAFTYAKAEYIRDKVSFRSEADFQYGAIKNAGQDMRKSLDRLFLDTKYGHNISKNWSLYTSVNFFSQFAQGFTYGKRVDGRDSAAYVSAFLAPGFVTESIGFEYKPVSYFFARFGTGTLRQTIVTDTTIYRNVPTNYGVPRGKKVRNELALQVQANFEKDIAKNLNLKARYTGFLNYQTIDDPKTWDHRIETTLLARINKYVSTTLTAILIYDKDADNDVQVSYQLGLGMLATFGKVEKK